MGGDSNGKRYFHVGKGFGKKQGKDKAGVKGKLQIKIMWRSGHMNLSNGHVSDN